jgi:uncharacterized membrane protein YbhN (UPF0104 family)
LLKKLKKKILLSVVIGGILYLAFTIYADFNQVVNTFTRFNWLLLPALLVLSFLNYLFRFFKWDYYLNVIKVKMKRIDSLSVFMSGLVMSVTPGKLGELLKSLLVKEITNTPISKTAPIVLAERITDFLSLLILAMIGAFIYDFGSGITLVVTLFFILLIVSAYESAYLLLKPLPLTSMTFLSLLAWGFECLGYYLVLLNFDVNFGLLWTSFSYSFSTIVGAISMLPGGLGFTEGSLTFLLIQKNISIDIAVTTTFIIRVVTLWFAVLVGIISVIFYQKRYGKITVDSI